MYKFVVMLSLSFISSVCFAVDRPKEFMVTGYGKVFYTVDIADIQFSVSVRDNKVQVCKAKHDAIIEKLNEYLKAQNYPKEILSLEGTILLRKGSTNSVPSHYLAKSTYSLRTSRIATLSALQADIVEIGVDEIQFVKLFSSKQRKLEEEARKHSIDDAKSMALQTAEELGWIIGKPVYVSYITNRRPVGFGSRAMSGDSGQGLASSNYVDASVQVTFAYSFENEVSE